MLELFTPLCFMTFYMYWLVFSSSYLESTERLEEHFHVDTSLNLVLNSTHPTNTHFKFNKKSLKMFCYAQLRSSFTEPARRKSRFMGNI